MAEKKYFWIKLSKAFFESKEVKKLRKLAGGDTYVIIYLKVQILSLENGGNLYFDGLENSFAEELALIMDESVNNIQMTLAFMQKCGLIEQRSEEEFFIPEVLRNFGAETSAAIRKRKQRERDKVALLCDNVTARSQIGHIDIDTDIDTEIELELDRESERKTEDGLPSSANTKASKSKRFVKPTVEQIAAYCKARNNDIDAQYFYDHYEANGWKVGGKAPMKDWQAAVRKWEHNNYSSGKQKDKERNTADASRFYEELKKHGGIF